MELNQNYKKLSDSYLFALINKKVKEYSASNTDKEIIKLGIGDVTLPLCGSVIQAMHSATEEMGKQATFRGYGEEQGYKFLRTAIQKYYKEKNVNLDIQDIFISDGAKTDLGNILELFSENNTVLISDPVYPVYTDTNIMSNHKIIYINANEENGFLPMPDENIKADLIYLCSPNNPTGAVYNKEQLKIWVEYANKNDSIILFDSAYERFIGDNNLPRSIFEIEGSKTCAIEFCSFSKTAGFTGVRCGYTIVPKELIREGKILNSLWLRRQTTKFNGVSYVSQRSAEAVFSEKGSAEIDKNINYYKSNAKLMIATLKKLNIFFTGGENSPYVFMKCPLNMSSWEFFDFLLQKGNIVGTPGCGFGKNGEGFFRLTAFNTYEKTKNAMERLENLL